ncbi:MAG: MMPL family transporter, partial [Myxococcales bacterium]|nr:MMPL family transporter [Myxococcales bacterium]
PRLTVDNSTESFLRPNDSARVDYDRFRAQFGQDERLIVAIRPREIFDLAFLTRLRTFHEDIEREVPYVEAVTSLWNARNTRGEGDELIVEGLLENWPETAADVGAVKRRVLENPLYLNTLIDESARITTVTIEPFIHSTLGDEADELAGFDGGFGEARPAEAPRPELLTERESREQIDSLRAVVARHEGPDFEVFLAGGPIMNRHATNMLMRDVTVFLSAGVAIVACILYLLFRRISGVVLPLFVVLAALAATHGMMAIAGIPTSLSLQVLPALLLTVGICSAIHVLAIAFQRLAAGDRKADAIAFAMGHSGLAILMAALTTAGGLFSFAAAPLAQVANLGRVAPVGILLTFLYCMTLLPALLAILPLRASPARRAEALQRTLGVALARVGDFATGNPWKVLAGSFALLVVFGFGIAQLRLAQYALNWFPEDDPVRMANEFMDRQLKGAAGLEFVIDSGRENGLHDPLLLGRIDAAMRFAESFDDGEIFVGKAVSIVQVVKETHRALNENRLEFYAIPQDRRLVAQELLLFENSGSDDLEEVTDSRFRLARVSLRLPFVDGMHYPALVAALERGFREILGEGVGIQPTGLGVLFGRTFSVVNYTMARSYVTALLIITPLMVLLIGNLKRGVLSMIPNLIPIWITLGVMGWLEIPLDSSSLLVGCIILGLAVDDTIHFMHKFQRYYEDTGDAREATRRTLRTTGAALLFTTLVLASGFFVLTFAYMRNSVEFGILASMAAIVAFGADLLVSPALMVLVSKRREPAPADLPLAPPLAYEGVMQRSARGD